MSEEKVVKRPARKAPRKKVCTFCVDKATEIDYKDVAKLRKFITEKGKILPRRMSGVCAKSAPVRCGVITRKYKIQTASAREPFFVPIFGVGADGRGGWYPY